jgi:AcrR family transcriptional regulator
MGRWEANAETRLREAAMALYIERGYAQVTVAEIAAEAGLTARTFFRYFADKREVLFAGSSLLQERMTTALHDAPADAAPMAAVAVALEASTEFLGSNREHSRRRRSVIEATPELHERELIKMASLTAALANGLRERGVPDPDASLAAEAGIAVFRVAFAQWTDAPDAPEGTTGPDLGDLMGASLERLTGLTNARHEIPERP